MTNTKQGNDATETKVQTTDLQWGQGWEPKSSITNDHL